ncbi:MAG: sortase [Firmicutes bacterium]|nr:sortase [Bacillota bacterium]
MSRSNMRKNIGNALMAVGLILIFAAVGLLYHNRMESSRAGQASLTIRNELAEAINEGNAVAAEPLVEEVANVIPSEYLPMEVAKIDDSRYLGILELPSLELSLPVRENWDYDSLKRSPCRYSGSYKNGDFVILAHNYDKHFGPLRRVASGADVVFITVTGERYKYIVSNVEIVEPTDIDYMIDAGADWDMTLFTCTTGGQARVAVRCVRTE